MKKDSRKRIALPAIGMRIIKSAFAVAICYLINMLRSDMPLNFVVLQKKQLIHQADLFTKMRMVN